MAASEDLVLVERFYQARGDRYVIDQMMSQDVVWDITPGFPLGGVYRGLETVLGNFLAPVGAQFSSLDARPEQLFADGDGHVVAVGYYAVTGHNGQAVEGRFVHVWTVANGQVNHLHQTADSRVLEDAMQEPRP
ncbi:nuclear transport factor 2 family protein [Arthrobacter sp. ISL-5]|uniref:nuclear transport factor 2 family protein n=1 Tax=Arthrobacter sp. ISL-5 TaxID=2819111 RepID=UPI001BE9FA4A|nr:nuclear transport factor 2 family protein [Arthrobacter sp. ISL-5]MBT2555967.1 nuclear transport factor 2 family protein [Arthrobacter sp. ISL-5]